MPHRLCIPVCLFVLAACPALADIAPHRTGAFDTTLPHRAPESEAAQLVQRFQWPRDWSEQDYTLANERFHVYVPEHYDPQGEPFGVLVWVSPSPDAHVPPPYIPVLDAHNLIWVCAYNNGNDRHLLSRLGTAIDGEFNIGLFYNVDPERIYVSGGSGGGRCASQLGVTYADVFQGAYPIIGCNFYRRIESPSRPGRYWRAYAQPPSRALQIARRQPMVILTGSGDDNREQCEAYARAFERDGFQQVTYIEVEGMGHVYPPADQFERGIAALDERIELPDALLRRQQTMQDRLDALLETLDDRPEATLRDLKQIARSAPDTPAGRQARLVADRLEYPVE